MILINYQDSRPIYDQVVQGFRELILNSVLKPDEKMPSVRNLAMELSINPNTIQRAYTELERQGFIYSVKGRGSFVKKNDNLKDIKQKEVYSELQKVVSKAKKMHISREHFLEKAGNYFEEEEE